MSAVYKRRLRQVKLVILYLTCRLKKVSMSTKEINEVKKKITLLYVIYKRLKNKISVSKVWVRPAYTVEQRLLQGDSDNLLVLLKTDRSMYFNYLRMNVETFEALHTLVRPVIEKKKTVVREPISSITRLQITLRYLASGDCMRSIAYAFRCAPNTVSEIVHETCQSIWLQLKELVLKKPSSKEWLEIAEDYESIWHFPHCIGAIDGKHIVMQAPANSGSIYYNYKRTHSFNLTGVADSHYRFILVDVGAAGRRSDAGVFANSLIKNGLDTNSFNVPAPSAVGNNSNNLLPFALVGDEAYPLATYLMKPYPRSSNLDIRKKIFNYRLSRARRVIENAFGILAARWRIFRRPINISVSRAKKIVLGTVCLHNFIITKELEKDQQHRQYTKLSTISTITNVSSGMKDIPQWKDRTRKQSAHRYRENFADYFMNDGAVEWRWEKAENNDF
ncbi:protein ALP1-like [Anoplophora glabripennis]|uniref:protein ALP1-like n=1 Tax=Anoplophora glabripennis TaxID=217634 RepID=UPI0008739A03|nr:protein ALP1-like [Anoplophora glabripennis]